MTDPTWLTGPVAVTGATGQVGTALRERLAPLPNEVRPLGRRDSLRTAFTGSDTVVHLAGTLRPRRPDSYRSANLDSVVATAEALRGTDVKRVVFLSYLDADPRAANPYLRFKGEAEQLLRDSGTPVVVFRAAHIYGSPDAPGPTATALLSAGGKPVSVLGSGQQRYAWVAKDDVVTALVHAALDPATPTGTFELAGPEAITVDDFVRHVNPPRTRIRHLPDRIARLLGRVLPSLPLPLVEVMLADCVSDTDAHDVEERFRVALHRLADSWRQPATGSH